MIDRDDSDLPNKRLKVETQPEILPTTRQTVEPRLLDNLVRRFKCKCVPCRKHGGQACFSLVTERTFIEHRKKDEELSKRYRLELARVEAEGIGGGEAQHAQPLEGGHIDGGSDFDCGSMTDSNDLPPSRHGKATRLDLPVDFDVKQNQQASEEEATQKESRAERDAEEAANEAKRRIAIEEDEEFEKVVRAAESMGLNQWKLKRIKLLDLILKHDLTRQGIKDSIARYTQSWETWEKEDVKDYKLFKLLTWLSYTSMKEYDCCRKSCMAFTGKHARDDTCAICGTSRWVEGSGTTKSAARFWYYSLSEQLKSRYRDPIYAEKARYRAKFRRSERVLIDVFDGDLYQRHLDSKIRIDDEELECKFYENDVDACIGILLDGFHIFDRGEHYCWPVVAIDYNLPLAERYQIENVLIVAIIPGPKGPKDFDSFLRPFVDDTKIWARHGSIIWDAVLQTTTTQKIFILPCSGDPLALELATSMKGHDAQVFQARPGTGRDNDYDPKTLPSRSHNDLTDQAQKVQEVLIGDYEKVSKAFGISRVPIMSEVPGIDMNRSFSMHLLCENVMKDLLKLWHGECGTSTLTGDYPFVISRKNWDLVDAELKMESRDNILLQGKNLPAPGRKQGSFTAKDYSNFLKFVDPAVLHKRLQEPYYSHFVQFRLIAMNLLDWNVPRQDSNQGGSLSEGIDNWVKQYEELYFGGHAELSPAMISPVHALLHACEHVRWLGPFHLSRSFLVERYRQHARSLVKTKRFPYASLAQSVLRIEQMKSVKWRYPQVVEATTEFAHGVRPAEEHEDGFS
ncbi:uncharacterized protein JCM15063_005303 [Sporobolomyces koalae]|uniref:uncharacterized protein n=1 Tax=Sporobolomyces koalae TaxID=500713 RepID=UPI00317F68CE